MTRRAIFLSAAAIATVFMIIVAHEVMTPFVLAGVVAYVLTPAVSYVERFRAPRPLAIVIVYIVVLGSMALFIKLISPRIGHEIGNLRREFPKHVAEAKQDWIPGAQDKLQSWGIVPPPQSSTEVSEPVPAVVVHPLPDGGYKVDVGRGFMVEPKGDGWVVMPREPGESRLDLNKLADDGIAKTISYVQENAADLLKLGGNLVMSTARGIFVFSITLMLAAYMMLTREKIFSFFGSLLRPAARPSLVSLIDRIDKGLAGVVRGQLIICVVNGLLSAIGFAIVGLKYWPVLALVAATLSLIPIFGSIVSSIPAVALGLTQGLGTAVFVLIWIIGIHQLEANLLNPKIMGDAAKIHPVLIIFSLIVGEHFFGAKGALLAVPCMSIAQSVFLHFRRVVQRSDPKAYRRRGSPQRPSVS